MRYDKAFLDSGYLTTLMTSFEFDPMVFEDVVLANLTKGRVRDITVIVDTNRLNVQLTDFGSPRLAGRSYHLAKRHVPGAFHPKIALQVGEKKARLMVASANLTGSGIMGNLEAVATLEVTEENPWAGPLLRAARDYIQSHTASSDQAAVDAFRRFDMRAPWLSDMAAARMVEDLDGHRHGFLCEDPESGIADQLLDFIGDDRVEDLFLVSPFWDPRLEAVSDLRKALGEPRTHLVLHPESCGLDRDILHGADCLLHDAQPLQGKETRRLHAKLLVARGERADYTMTGSANMTRAGLFSRFGGPHNAEACLVRTEDPGTAVVRLGLSACLNGQLAPTDLPVLRKTTSPDEEKPTPRDGGSLSLQDDFLTWNPPETCAAADCHLEIQGPGGSVLVVARPRKDCGRLGLSVADLSAEPRRARVLFPNGTASATVPVADLDRLARAAYGILPKAQARLLAEIGDMRSFDGEALDLALQIRAMVDAEHHRRATTRPSGKTRTDNDTAPDQGDDTTPITRDMFLGIDDAARSEDAETAYRHSAMGEIRRQIIAALGLGLEITSEDGSDADESGLDAADLAPSDEQQRAETREAHDDEDEDADDPAAGDEETVRYGTGEDDSEDGSDRETGDGESPPDHPPGPLSGRNQKKDSKKPPRYKSLSSLETQMAGHLQQIREEVKDPRVDPLSLRNAMSLTMAIFAVLNDAAPVGHKPTSTRPMPAKGTARSSGWITLLGGLIATCRDRLPGSRVLQHPLDQVRIDCLAALLFAARVLADAAAEAQISPRVRAEFEKLHPDLARLALAVTRDQAEASARLQATLLGWERVHCDTRAEPA
jgi:hypothetical protein